MDGSFKELIYFPAWPLPETAIGGLCNASWVPYHGHYQARDTIVPLVRSKSSPLRTNNLL